MKKSFCKKVLSCFVMVTILALSIFSAGLPVSAASSCTVTWTDVKQSIDGFGISEAFHQSANINLFPEPKRTEILDLLFSQTKGAGFSILRNIVGDGGTWGNATDGPNKTMEPSEGVWDWTASNDDQIDLCKLVKTNYGVNEILYTAWSPPAWMKTTGSVAGGSLKTDKYQAYATYLSTLIKGYKSNFGIDITAIGLANEPDLTTSYSSCTWTSANFLDFVKNYLKPTFDADGITAKVVVGEPMNYTESMATGCLNDATAVQRTDIVGCHIYSGSISAFPTTKSKNKKIWQTEISNMSSNDPSITDGLKWAKQVHDCMTITELNAWNYWWGACYKTSVGEGLIRMDMNAKTYTADKRLYTIGNYSRFVRPGWVRIGATASPVSNVYVTAYKEASTGKFAVVAINNGSTSQDINYSLSGFSTTVVTPYRTSATENLAQLTDIAVSNGAFTATLPANSITTFTGTAGSTNTPPPVTITPTPTPTPSTATPTATPSTATPTATPSAGTATPTPTPSTATPTPTPTPSAGTPAPGGIKVQFFNGNTAATTNTLYTNFKVVNTGTAAVSLSDVKMRYYFTNDGTQANSFACDYSTIGSGNVTGSFTTIAKTNADRYLEVGFTSGAGSLGVGAGIEVKARVWKSDWSNFTQTNDYSFNATATNYVDVATVTGYIAGALKWGTEP